MSRKDRSGTVTAAVITAAAAVLFLQAPAVLASAPQDAQTQHQEQPRGEGRRGAKGPKGKSWGARGEKGRSRGAPPAFRMLERLNSMTPEQREQVLSSLPPPRRAQLERRLEQYNQMPLETRERLQRRWERLQEITPQERQQLRGAFRQFRQLAPERRTAVRREMNRLSAMEPARRKAELNSRDFRQRFSPGEQRILERMEDLLAWETAEEGEP
jgi:hypothetical protein